MLLESDEYVNESNLSDSFHRTDPLCELDFEKPVWVARRMVGVSRTRRQRVKEILIQMFENEKDEVTKYGLLLSMLYYLDPEIFWAKLGELNPSLIFSSKIGFSGEEEEIERSEFFLGIQGLVV